MSNIEASRRVLGLGRFAAASALVLVSGCSASDDVVNPAPVDSGVDSFVADSEGETNVDTGADSTRDSSSIDVTDATDVTDVTDGDGASSWPAGSITQATLRSTVGVLLDELPSAQRDAITTELAAKPDDFWIDRARRQAKLTGVRLVFRYNYYTDKRDSLPIGPDSNWRIVLLGKPTRRTIGTHDVVALDYALTAVILSDVDSPGISEPALSKVGGIWDEPFTFPVDPELLLQRTRYACLNEAEFPPHSVDSEEVDSMYDDNCGVETALTNTGCHQTELPPKSCKDTLDETVGAVSTVLRFERRPYDKAIADSVRTGTITTTAGADLTGIPEQFGVHRVVYRYIPADSCTLVEECVGAAGWRRLLQFTGSDKNVGGKAMEIGAIDYFKSGTVASQLIAHHVYEWSACHGHYHFMHYGTFSFGSSAATNAKRGFCLQSTNRFENNEYGPLTNPYADCTYQGVGTDWGDEYRAGLECQWVDVTTEDTHAGPVKKPLKFTTNPDGFLCEGTYALDASGALQFTPTSFKTAAGEPVDKPKCDYVPGWDANNTDTVDATLPPDGEGYVTQPCTHGQIGPLRNCGLAKAPAASHVLSCTPGKSIKVSCTVGTAAAPQVVRVCDYSAALKTGIPCTQQESLANGSVPKGAATDLTVTCPAARDAKEPGGKVSIYSGPAYNSDAASDVTCVVK